MMVFTTLALLLIFNFPVLAQKSIQGTELRSSLREKFSENLFRDPAQPLKTLPSSLSQVFRAGDEMVIHFRVDPAKLDPKPNSINRFKLLFMTDEIQAHNNLYESYALKAGEAARKKDPVETAKFNALKESELAEIKKLYAQMLEGSPGKEFTKTVPLRKIQPGETGTIPEFAQKAIENLQTMGLVITSVARIPGNKVLQIDEQVRWQAASASPPTFRHVPLAAPADRMAGSP